jgi:PhnB protein
MDKKGLETWFSTFNGPIEYDIRELTIATGDDIAFCHSLDHMSGTMSDGQKTDLWLRNTIGLRKIDGKWKITHQHESVPFYMDGSFKAAIDLKP